VQELTSMSVEWNADPGGRQTAIVSVGERRFLLSVTPEPSPQSESRWASSIHELHADGRSPTLRMLSAAANEAEVKERALAAAQHLVSKS
jgi:hypothetical protein